MNLFQDQYLKMLKLYHRRKLNIGSKIYTGPTRSHDVQDYFRGWDLHFVKFIFHVSCQNHDFKILPRLQFSNVTSFYKKT